MRSRRRTLLVTAAALLILSLATASRIRTINNLRDQGWFDKYPSFARRLLAGTLPADRISDASPAYLGLVTLLHARAGMDLRTLRALQVGATTIAAAACGVAAAALGGLGAGVAAAVLVLGSRAALVNATEFEPETLVLVLNSFAALFVALWERTRRTGFVIGAGASLGLSAITRPTALLALFVVSLWIARTHRVRAAAVFLIGILPVVAVIAMNVMAGRSAAVMDPGTVFYEGMNPLATGYGGVQPRIVNDLERVTPEADALHITYRIVASRALQREVSREESNRYWTRKALNFIREFPARAATLTARKLRLIASSYEAYDLSTMVKKDWELQRQLWLPFTGTLALAVIGATARREVVSLLLLAAATAAPLVVFYVTARQRNAVLPALAVVAGTGVTALIKWWRERRRLAFLAAILVGATATLGSMPGHVQREDLHAWQSVFAAEELRRRAASAAGPVKDALFAHAATWLTGRSAADIPRERLTAAAISELTRTTDRPRLFDLAVVLIRAGELEVADDVLQRLEGYRPIRDTRCASSVAYYRARASVAAAPSLLPRAMGEAPGDPDVLALRVATANDRDAVRQLDLLHDPFTRDLALAEAYTAASRHAEAAALMQRLSGSMPEWRRLDGYRTVQRPDS